MTTTNESADPCFARPEVIVCADWSSKPAKRAVWAAEPEGPEGPAVYRLKPPEAIETMDLRTAADRMPGNYPGDPISWMEDQPPQWYVSDILAEIERRYAGRRVLLGFDAPLGLPASYLRAAQEEFDLPSPGFLPWLVFARPSGMLWSEVHDPADWSLVHPFFRARGKGTWHAFEEAARAKGVDLLRVIERDTGAKSVFALGIPGQVGPAARHLWCELEGTVVFTDRRWQRFDELSDRELSELGERTRVRLAEEYRLLGAVKLWPFAGALSELCGRPGVTVAEIYPRAAYETALGPGWRALDVIKKSGRTPPLGRTPGVVRVGQGPRCQVQEPERHPALRRRLRRLPHGRGPPATGPRRPAAREPGACGSGGGGGDAGGGGAMIVRG